MNDHLLLDGTAFLILYDGLLLETRWQRLASVALPAAGSLLLACWLAPSLIAAHGLCGLSGVAHGQMAFPRWNGLPFPAHPNYRIARCNGNGYLSAMITIESTEREIRVTIPRDSVDEQSLDAVLRWLEFDGIARTSTMTSDEAFRLAEESKADWWENNRRHFLPIDAAGS